MDLYDVDPSAVKPEIDWRWLMVVYVTLSEEVRSQYMAA